MSSGSILVVEDDRQNRDFVSKFLKREGYDVRVAESLFRARVELSRATPDMLLLDRQLPDGDGLELCRQVRQKRGSRKPIPILFLTAKGSTAEKVKGLTSGGDDYLAKPFHIEELLARVRVLLRRARTDDEPARVLRRGGVALDLQRRRCAVNGRSIKLWPKEFELLQALLSRAGEALSKEFLSEDIWGHEYFSSSRTIDITVQRLRAKLGAKGHLIETVRGYGFRFAGGEA